MCSTVESFKSIYEVDLMPDDSLDGTIIHNVVASGDCWIELCNCLIL